MKLTGSVGGHVILPGPRQTSVACQTTARYAAYFMTKTSFTATTKMLFTPLSLNCWYASMYAGIWREQVPVNAPGTPTLLQSEQSAYTQLNNHDSRRHSFPSGSQTLSPCLRPPP